MTKQWTTVAMDAGLQRVLKSFCDKRGLKQKAVINRVLQGFLEKNGALNKKKQESEESEKIQNEI